MKWHVLTFLLWFGSACGQFACPRRCLCSGPPNMIADCTPRPELTGTDILFTAIPQDGDSRTRVLIMSGNLLSSLLPASFAPYPLLETLVLNDNLFTEVPSEGFHNLSITNLTFDGNPLTELGPAAFSSLTSLQHLSVRRSPSLTFINGREVFEGLDSLATLSLDDNLLQDLPEDFLNSTLQLRTLSLKNNSLQTLPDGFFSSIVLSQFQVDLSLNPWSCDCFLQWFRTLLVTTNILLNDLETLCHWPPPHNNPRTQISQLSPTSYQCYEPNIIEHPTNSTLLSNVSLVIPCGVNSAPFPEVTWTKDGVPINLTSRVHISRYNASLQFESQVAEDSGEYQCLLVNENGSAESDAATIVILESTCFDNAFTASHETDQDCGGDYCIPCNITQNCLLDRDCVGDLVCLYSHPLPSFLHYISSSHPYAHTCAESSVPETLLEAILQSKFSSDIYSVNVSAGADTQTLHAAMHDFLALQLQVFRSTIQNVRLSSVEKILRPLIQVWFDLPRTAVGEEAGVKVLEQIDSGDLKVTLRIKEESNFINYRLNL